MKFEQLTRFARGFVYAYNGIRAAIREERNFRFHLCAALYAFVAAYWAQLLAVETALIALCVAAVLALTMWRSGTLWQLMDIQEQVKSWMPASSQSQSADERLGRPVQDDRRPSRPETLGRPVEDTGPKQSADLAEALNDLLFGRHEHPNEN